MVHSEHFLIVENLDGPAVVFEQREDRFAPIKPFLLYALSEKMSWLPEKRFEAQVQGDTVLMVFESTFKVLACLFMLTIGLSHFITNNFNHNDVVYSRSK